MNVPPGVDKALWDDHHVNEDHLAAFSQALSSYDYLPLEGDQSPSSPKSPKSPPIGIPPDGPLASAAPGVASWNHGPSSQSGSRLGDELNGYAMGQGRVEKLTATSDFAPIHQRVRRRRTKASQLGITYHLFRWPLLGTLFLIIFFEFGAYVFTRQVVNVFEWALAWRGHKRNLRKELRSAKTYEDWIAAAKKLDEHLDFDEWKETEDDSYFDYHLVRRVRRTLSRLRAAGDARGLMDALAVCVRSNFAGTEGVKMYSETFFGTKKVIESHIQEVVASLDFVRTATDVTNEEKRTFFRRVNKNYGSSVLCLSGGASFGYYHFGVIKAFLDADLLPRVITGTSAGGLVAALLCTHTNAELKQLLRPELADKITACEDPFRVWFKRWRETGARFSALEWARKSMFFTRGSLTFKEAYERTGRALNVSVVPSDRHSPTILLNHLTAPNCIIWSAIIASAAVPGILNPVVLMAKDRDGLVKPHNLGGSRFKDGSLREDIPLGSLHTQFNANFSIVSQTNPHIHLFFFAPRGSVGRPVAHRKGKGWRGGFILSALESYIKLDLTKHFKVIRDLDLMPQLLQSDWSGVFLQRFSGDLTLTPRSTLGDWLRILSDPTPAQLARMLDVGQRVAWPALHMVSNRMTIERAILRGRAEVRLALKRDRPTTDQGSPHRRGEGYATPSANDGEIPIESDADAGFAFRTRRAKAAGAGGIGRTAAAEIFGLSNGDATRRRRVGQRNPRRRASDIIRFDTDSSDAAMRATASATVSPVGPSGLRRSSVITSPPVPSSARTYANQLGDTFRHVRTSSLSAFSGNFSPFRSLRGGTLPNDDQSSNPLTPHRRSGSRMSVSRWFGAGGQDSSSDDDEEDEEEEVALRGLSSADGMSMGIDEGEDDVEEGPSGSFHLDSGESAIVDDEDVELDALFVRNTGIGQGGEGRVGNGGGVPGEGEGAGEGGGEGEERATDGAGLRLGQMLVDARRVRSEPASMRAEEARRPPAEVNEQAGSGLAYSPPHQDL